MKRFRFSFYLVGFMVVAVAMHLAGCDSPDTLSGVTLEQQVGQRAEARWEALSAGDFSAAYAFETPAYRQITTVDRFRGGFGGAVSWRGAEATVVKLGEEGDVAQVNIVLSYIGVMPTGESYEGQQAMREVWILVDGEWWHIEK